MKHSDKQLQHKLNATTNLERHRKNVKERNRARNRQARISRRRNR